MARFEAVRGLHKASAFNAVPYFASIRIVQVLDLAKKAGCR
jgi:hypothetical protein